MSAADVINGRVPERVAIRDLEPGDVFESFGWQMPVVFLDAERYGLTEKVMLRGHSLRPNRECGADGIYAYLATPGTLVTVLRAEVAV
jgi:hypothetical protein